MFELPDFFDQLKPHQQQMLLVHAAMYEDVCSVASAHMGEYFRLDPDRRTTSFYAEGLAWAVQSMASEAAMELGLALTSLHLDARDKGMRTTGTALRDRTDHGRIQTAYKTIRGGFQALRSHGMRAKQRSGHWDRVAPQYLDQYWEESLLVE